MIENDPLEPTEMIFPWHFVLVDCPLSMACPPSVLGYRGFNRDSRQHLALGDQPKMNIVAWPSAIEPQAKRVVECGLPK